MSNKKQTVIIVDDDPQYSELLSEMLITQDYNVIVFTNPVLFLAAEIPVNSIILLDLKMPQLDGVEVIREMANLKIMAQIILVSGYDIGVLHAAQQLAKEHGLNVVDRLTKPVKMSDLKSVLSGLPGHKTILSKSGNEPKKEITVEELKNAITDEQLILHYQPQVDIKTGELVGVEALVRWEHPQRGLIYPNDFISFAENNELIGELTALVIRMSVEQNKEWKSKNLNLQVSINVSADNITSLTFPEQLIQFVEQNHLHPSMVSLEITESALMGELVTSLDILTRLRMKGFKLSIDDFGTGYSSLSQLHRVPFTELKIDQSFIINIDKDEEAKAIVETCIMLGRKLKMKTIAEGVESEIILNMLKEMNCEIAQGYYIARPMPAESLFEWHVSRNNV